ncbi:MAG: hypothetical protein LBV04_04250 [Deferribacteraceae bacterium]|jgi:hypothetical protein|nr:hypothetical protein [Deferribacteraceae bacterium]
MAVFMHLFPESKKLAIIKNGIIAGKLHFENLDSGVFCMPVIQDFYATHQWAREMMRWGKKSLMAAYFRIPDQECVYFGHYNDTHSKNTADIATKAFYDLEDRMGFQVVIPRKIASKEIFRTKSIPAMGWRFYPAAKGKTPCLCPACLGRGEYGSAKMLKQKFDAHFKSLSSQLPASKQIDILVIMQGMIADHSLRFAKWQELLNKVDMSKQEVIPSLCDLLLTLKNSQASKMVLELMRNCAPKIQASIASLIIWRYGNIEIVGDFLTVPEVKKEVDEFMEVLSDEN